MQGHLFRSIFILLVDDVLKIPEKRVIFVWLGEFYFPSSLSLCFLLKWNLLMVRKRLPITHLPFLGQQWRGQPRFSAAGDPWPTQEPIIKIWGKWNAMIGLSSSAGGGVCLPGSSQIKERRVRYSSGNLGYVRKMNGVNAGRKNNSAHYNY